MILFLTDKFKAGASYDTLNSFRSVVSLISAQEHVLSNTHIKRFFKGIFKLKPQTPRYEEIWDPSPVLTFLSNFYPNKDFPLQNLSIKLVTSLAFITVQRVQTLSKILINTIHITEDIVRIKIKELLKTSAINRMQPYLKIPFYKDKPAICVASTRIAYMEMTKMNLFITTRKPHQPASSRTLARWIKDALQKSGIDEVFTAHSTRQRIRNSPTH